MTSAFQVLSAPSGYSIVDIAPMLPGALPQVLGDSGHVVFATTDPVTLVQTFYLHQAGTTTSYGSNLRVFEINSSGQSVGWTFDGGSVATLWNGTSPATGPDQLWVADIT